MPTLKELATRRPDLYADSDCIMCKEGKKEDQDHLAVCSCYEKLWMSAETLATSVAWNVLSEEGKKNSSQARLKEAIWSQTKEERTEVRKKLIKGLLQEKSIRRVQEILVSVQETRKLLASIVDTV